MQNSWSSMYQPVFYGFVSDLSSPVNSLANKLPLHYRLGRLPVDSYMKNIELAQCTVRPQRANCHCTRVELQWSMEVKSDHREAEGISRPFYIFVTRYSERGPAQIAPAKLGTLQEIEGPKWSIDHTSNTCDQNNPEQPVGTWPQFPFPRGAPG